MKLSTHTLREQLLQQQWTAHNIRLTEELTTIPGQPDFLTSDIRLAAILRTLRTFYHGSIEGLRIADLGCLEGGYSLALAQQGASLLGLEARQQNFVKLELIQEHFDLANLQFKKADVKNFTREAYGVFDTVLALGILYHLDEPVEWLSQIADTVKDILIVDSHYAPADEADLSLLRPSLKHLGELQQINVNNQTFAGRWFFEYPQEADKESQLWASYSNNKSFWLTKEALLLALRQAGFDLIFEQHDYSVRKYKIFTTEYPRVFLVAVKRTAFTSTSG
jgi:hypothetical protein